MTRITTLAELDGLPLTPEARLPHPSLLSKWQGLYSIDANAGRFVLNDEGRKVAQWDADAAAARDEFRKVTCVLPHGPDVHPMSGLAGEY